MAGRKVFTSGEILLASEVNSFLMDQSVMVFADSSARSSAIPSPSEGMVTYLKDEDEVTVFDGNAFKAVGPGKILQVVHTAKTDSNFSTSSTSFTPITGLTASITPTSTSSTIMVFAAISVGANDDIAAHRFRLTRGGSPIGVGDAVGSRLQATSGSNTATVSSGRTANHSLSTHPIQFLDSPASVATLTYGVDTGVSVGIVTVNRNVTFSDNTFMSNATGISTMTLMEVAG